VKVQRRGETVFVHATKAVGRVEVQLHSFLTAALDGDQCSALRPGRFTTGTH
jgi:hypothetical protein